MQTAVCCAKNEDYCLHCQGDDMKSFLEYVDEAQAKLKLSDAALSKKLGGEENRTLVSSWRNRGSSPEDYYCILIAEELGIDPLEVIAAANYARTKDETKKTWWENFSKQHVKTVAGVLLCLSVLFAGFCTTTGSHEAEIAAAIFAIFLLRIMYIMSSCMLTRTQEVAPLIPF